jgi:hypothetical protein
MRYTLMFFFFLVGLTSGSLTQESQTKWVYEEIYISFIEQKQLAYVPNETIVALKTELEKQYHQLFLIRFNAENARKIIKSEGRNPTDGEISLFRFFSKKHKETEARIQQIEGQLKYTLPIPTAKR